MPTDCSRIISFFNSDISARYKNPLLVIQLRQQRCWDQYYLVTESGLMS